MKTVTRLLEKFAPKNYQIILNINEEQLTFSGEVKIMGKVCMNTNNLAFHAKDLDFNEIKGPVEIIKHKLNKSEQTVEIELSETIKAGSEVEFIFSYSAMISQTMHGVYPAKYKENGKDKTIISTQFESHHAREAFPCIDEPAAKASFQLSLINSPAQMVVSNTMPKSSKESSGRKTTIFKPTPIMSTYLLAFAIGDFNLVESVTKRGVALRVLAPKSHVDKLDFALDVSIKCLDFFEEYFGIDYPLEKCDLIAIPEFAAGAMENWGCITFRETAILVDKQNSSLANQQWVALVIAHELAHQWFGNLVTMTWWDDLWLNEGFASWVEFLAINKLFPDWNMWTNFVSEDYAAGLRLDALSSSHPIRVDVHDPREINEIFDSITYRKGASIIRMLHDFVGAKQFQIGLQNYLYKNQYSNATTEDLWRSLTDVCDIDVANFMDKWTKATGYPILKIKSNKITQQRFLLNPNSKDADQTIWHVPLFNKKNQILKAESIDQEVSTKLNLRQSGFYRSDYDKSLLSNLASQVADGSMSAEDRLGLLDDTFAIVKSGHSNTTDALELVSNYTKETQLPVWDILGHELSHLRQVLLGEKNENKLTPLIHELIKDRYLSLGWSDSSEDSDNDRLVRPIILSLATKYKYQDAPDKVTELFKQRSNDPIPADFRSFIYSHIARTGSKTEYEQLFADYLAVELQEEKQRLARALTAFKESSLISKSLELIRSEHVRQQDVISWLAGLFSNAHSQQQVWQWYKDNWTWLQDNFKDGHIYSYLAQILGNFKTMEDHARVVEFFENNDTTGLQRSLDQALEKIEYQALWAKRDASSTIKYLSSL